jgi:hypothetical protein
MIQDGELFCDACKEEITLSDKSSLQMLIEIVQDDADRHYCEHCAAQLLEQSRAGETRLAKIRSDGGD